MKIALQRHVNAPVDMVFDTIAHIDNFRQAVSDIVAVEFLGEIRSGIGTRFSETRRMGGRDYSTEIEVTDYVPNERVRLVLQAGGAEWDTVFTVRPANNGTVIGAEMTATPKSLLARVLVPMMKKSVSAAMENDLRSVKQWCETKRAGDSAAPE